MGALFTEGRSNSGMVQSYGVRNLGDDVLLRCLNLGVRVLFKCVLWVAVWCSLLLPKQAYAEFPDVLAAVKPSVVGIALYTPAGRPQTRLLGTGFAVGSGHFVATNEHVIPALVDLEKRQQLVILRGSGAQAKMISAEVVAKHAEHDLAVLKVGVRLPPMHLASDDSTREGEIYAFTGFPIGAVLGLYPVTHRGMLASKTPMAIPASTSKQLDARKISVLRNPIRVYQLDATAYPGNSGSPLYSMETGDVVGILNQVFIKASKEDVLSQPSGITYAIPVKYLRSMLENLD